MQEQCEKRSGEECPHSAFKDSCISCQRGDLGSGEEKAEWEVEGGR